MVTTGLQTTAAPLRQSETEVDRLSRIKREEAFIARAEADIDAGLGIDDDALEEWLDALDRDENTSLPDPRNDTALR